MIGKGHSLPSISENFSTFELIDLYCQISERKSKDMKANKYFEVGGKKVRTCIKYGGKNGIPRWTKVFYKDSLLIWVKGTRFNRVNDIAISIHSSPKKVHGPKRFEVHNGYLKAARKIIAEINDNYNEYKEVVFFGHSLGAATALIAAIVLQEEYKLTNVRGFGFAPPRCVSESLAKITAGYCLSLIGNDDVVPSASLTKLLGFINGYQILAKSNKKKFLMLKMKKNLPDTVGDAVDQFRQIDSLRIPQMHIYLESQKKKEVNVRLLTALEEKNSEAKFIGVFFKHPARRYFAMAEALETTKDPTVHETVKQLISHYDKRKQDLIDTAVIRPTTISKFKPERRNENIKSIAAQFEEDKIHNAVPSYQKEVPSIKCTPEQRAARREFMEKLDESMVENLRKHGYVIQYDKLDEMIEKMNTTDNKEEQAALQEQVDNIKNDIDDLLKNSYLLDEDDSTPHKKKEKKWYHKLLKGLKIAGIVVLAVATSPITLPVAGGLALYDHFTNG